MHIQAKIKKTTSVYFFFPLSLCNLKDRWLKTLQTICCFKAALDQSSDEISNYIIHFHFNDASVITDDCRRYGNRLIDLLSGKIIITYACTTGKISSINFGIQSARAEKFNYFFCIDNDILFSKESIKEMVTSCSKKTGIAASAGYKVPYINGESTGFQKLYSFGILSSFYNDIYYKRPTGSFYCLNLSEFGLFPADCNEGDYLDTININKTRIIVYSEYPKTFSQEVTRRKRLLNSSLSIGYERINFNKDYLLLERKKSFLPAIVKCTIYNNAFELQLNIINNL